MVSHTTSGAKRKVTQSASLTGLHPAGGERPRRGDAQPLARAQRVRADEIVEVEKLVDGEV